MIIIHNLCLKTISVYTHFESKNSAPICVSRKRSGHVLLHYRAYTWNELQRVWILSTGPYLLPQMCAINTYGMMLND